MTSDEQCFTEHQSEVAEVILSERAKKAVRQLISDEDYAFNRKHFTVRQPRIKLISGIILSLFFCGIWLGTLWYTRYRVIEYYQTTEVKEALSQTLMILAIAVPGILWGVWLLFRVAIWRVQVEGDRIIYRSFLCRKTEFALKDVQVKPYVTDAGVAILVYVRGKKIFAVEPTYKNYFMLLLRLAEQADAKEE